MSRTKLLFLSPFPYGHSSGNGGATACFNALRLLATEYEIGVLTFSMGRERDIAGLQDMKVHTSFIRVVQLRVSRWSLLRAKVRSLFTNTPELAVFFESEQMRSSIHTVIMDYEPQAVMVQFPQMAQYLRQLSNVHTVLDVQDAYSVSWYRRASTTQGCLKRLYAYKQWLNWLAYERRNYELARQVWTLSEQDRFGLTVFNPGLRPVTVSLPLVGVVEHVGESDGVPTIGFIASFGYHPNIEALTWLMDEVIPAVFARQPNVRWLIAGRNPPEALVRRAPANLQFLGFVESLPDFYRQCTVIVAPLRSGGGVKVKVAEALSFGKPIITTSVGVEGIGAVSGEHLVVRDAPGPFAEAITQLVNDESLRERLAQAAAKLAVDKFSEQAWLRRCKALLDGTMQITKGV